MMKDEKTDTGSVPRDMPLQLCVKLRIDGNEYLIPIHRVKNVIADPVATEVPGSMEGIEGITEFDGRIIPWIRMDGQERRRAKRCGVIMEMEEGRLAGILADDDIEVLPAPVQEAETEITRRYICLLKGSVT